MTDRSLIVAILAGGGSRRMGEDKAFVEVEGVPMIRRVVDAVVEAGLPPVVIAPRTPAYLALGVNVYEDIIPGMGPLSGLHTSFAVTDADRVLLVGCDMPGVRPALLSYLASLEMGEADARIPYVDGREQGLLAVYGRAGVERAAPQIEAKVLQFDAFRRGLRVKRVEEEELRRVDPDLVSFDNLNRPDEVARWRLPCAG